MDPGEIMQPSTAIDTEYKPQPIRIVLADDHPIVRDGLRKLLTLEEDIEIVGEASDGREAVRLANELKPDIVIIDIGMPLLNGLDVVREIRRVSPQTKSLLLTMHN